jgi:propanol-preferring alcohol dehydrogenase
MACRRGIPDLHLRHGDGRDHGAGSIVGTRLDMIEALSFFADGKVKTVIEPDRLENINEIFAELEAGTQGRKVLDLRG